MKITSFLVMRSVCRFRAGLAGLALSAFAAFGNAQNAHAAPAGPSNNQTSACPTTPSHPSPPPAQPVQVTVVNPVAVTGTVDIGNKVEISGRVETLNDALKTPVHFTVNQVYDGGSSIRAGEFYTVPVGMRLTIESVSVRILVPVGQKVFAALELGDGDVPIRNYLALQPQGSFFNGSDDFILSQNLKLIADSSSPHISYRVFRNSIVGSISFEMTVNGYLEEVP